MLLAASVEASLLVVTGIGIVAPLDSCVSECMPSWIIGLAGRCQTAASACGARAGVVDELGSHSGGSLLASRDKIWALKNIAAIRAKSPDVAKLPMSVYLRMPGTSSS